MTRRSITTSQLVAWTVPFLLVLLLVPVAPRIETVVRTQLLRVSSAPTVHHTRQVPKANRPSTMPRARAHIAPAESAARVAATTMSATGSSAPSASIAKLPVTEPVAKVTPTLHGVLEPPYTIVVEPLATATAWVLSSDATVSASLTCAAGPVSVDLPNVVVPSGTSDCQLQISTDATVAVSWTLEPVQ